MSAPGKDGHSLRDHLQVAAKRGMHVPDLDPPDIPPGADVLLEIFWQLRRALRGNGFGVPGIGLHDLVAWQHLYRARLLPSEVDTLLAMDNAFIAALPKQDVGR